MLEPPQQLGRPVPQGHDLIGEHVFLPYLPAEPKIGQFDFSLVIEEDIGGLDVPVEYFVLVEVGDALEELPEDALDFGEGELAAHPEESCEVVIHILED